MKHVTLIVTLLFSVTLIGCGSDVPFGGTVKFVDGSPVAGALVVFTDGGKLQYDGRTDEQGRYRLSGATPQSGLPARTYGVAVFVADDNGKSLILEKYGNAATSGLSIEVKKGTKGDFVVEK